MTARRGYSKAFPGGKDRATTGYVLNAIPSGLWKKAQTRARREGRTMRAVLLTLIADWVTSPAADADVVRFDPADLLAASRQVFADFDKQIHGGRAEDVLKHWQALRAAIRAADAEQAQQLEGAAK